MNKRGKFIVLEGSEGSGKSSQLKKIAEILGDDVVVTREPGGTPYAEEIRHVILKSENAAQANEKTLFALFWASRADHLKNKIIPALEAGKTVICDRFDSTTYAYQTIKKEGQDVSNKKPHRASGEVQDDVKKNFFFFRDFFVGDYKPDLYIYLDVDIETGLKRKSLQKDEINHIDRRTVDFFTRAKKQYQEFFAQVPSVVVDANPAFDVVTEKLLKIIREV